MNELPPLACDQRKIDADHLNLLAIFHFVGAGLAALLVSAGALSAAEPVLPSSTNATLISQEPMTPARFKEIVAMPGDGTPLIPKLATASPVWPKATVSVVMKYASGKTFTEEVPQTAKTIGGRYIVFAGQSSFYHQTMYGILTYEEPAAAYKLYGLYGDGHGGDLVIAGTVVFDTAQKTYTMSSSYGDGFKEHTTGSYSDTENSDRTLLYKNGEWFMTRETKSHPVAAGK
jgi:hypothetical protein